MKATCLLTLLVVIFSLCQAQAATFETYSYVFQKKKVSVPIGKVSDVRFNDLCVKDQEHCQALKAYLHPVKKFKPHNRETYASDYCDSLGGAPLVLTGPGGGASLFCTFKDLTMVDARALASPVRKSASGGNGR